MRFFNKSKKSRHPSQQPASLGIPTNIAIGSLDTSAELGLNVGPGPGENDEGGSRIVVRNSSEARRPRASGASTLARHRGDGTKAVYELHERKNTLKDQLGQIDPDLSAVERKSDVRDQDESKGQGTVAERPPEVFGERTSERERVCQDASDITQLDGSSVVETNLEDTSIANATIPVDEESTPGFGSLKTVLLLVSTSYQEVVAVGKKIEGLLFRIVALEQHFNSRPSDVAELNRRDQVIKDLKAMGGRLRLLSEMPEQTANPLQKHEKVSGLLEDLQEIIFNYQMTQQLAAYEEGCEKMNPAEATILNNFRGAQGAEYRHGGRKGCLKGTREAVLDMIELWAKDWDKLPVYWLNGLAGTGKSTIAQTIAERTFADGRLGASFFCSRDFEDRSNLHLIFPTLAVQLARKYSAFRSAFIRLAQSDPGIAHETLYNQMDKLIMRPLKTSSISTVIIIDALDECQDEEPASAILSVLGRFVSELPHVKFFLTGRPEPRILDGFRLPLLVGVTDIFILHGVESNQVYSDIRRFFENSFSELGHRRLGLNGWPSEAQLNILCERAAGFFVYAVATVKFVSRQNSNPRTQMDRLLQYRESTVYEGKTKFKPNTTLDSLYLSILQEAFDDDDPEIDPKIRSVLGAVVLTTNPLSASSIATVLRFDTGDLTPLLSSIHSLLILPEDIHHPVRPFHKSFPDFLTDPIRCTNQRFYISSSHNLELLVSLLELMNQSLEKNMCCLPDAVKNSQVDDLKERTEQYLNHALQYACKSWHKHLVDEPSANRHEVISALHYFLEKKFLCWLEVLSVLGAVRNAVDALQAAIKWLQVCQPLVFDALDKFSDISQESEILELTNDCFRFVAGFFEVITTSAPHIYHSALLLCPKESIVRRLYEPQAKPMARVILGLPTSWDPNVAATRFPSKIRATAWSPCSRFIATSHIISPQIVVLGTATLEPFCTLQPPQWFIQWSFITFSPSSHLLTGFSQQEHSIITWDLQTGGMLSNIVTNGKCDSLSYSECESMIGGVFDSRTILTYNIFSGTSISSHSIQQDVLQPIGTLGQYLQFATLEAKSITIWQVSFTSGHVPSKIGSLSTPGNFSSDVLVLLPTHFRFAFTLDNKVHVWDAQHNKVLLEYESRDCSEYGTISFSSDGCFFAYGSTRRTELYLWKESSNGYLSHQKLVSSTDGATPLISPNGQSIILVDGQMLQLWPIDNSPTSPSGFSTQVPAPAESFFIELLPDESLVAFAQRFTHTVTILDTTSGNPWLVLNTKIEICGLRMTRDKIIVVGRREVLTMNLPARGGISDASRNIHRSFQIALKKSLPTKIHYASVSPNLNYLFCKTVLGKKGHEVYNMDTGKRLASLSSSGNMIGFNQSGKKIWCAVNDVEVDIWEIDERCGSGGITLYSHGSSVKQQSGFPWQSPSGYLVTDNGWILSSSRKQLFWLPHHWQQSGVIQRKWSGKLLAIWNTSSPVPYILELEV